MSNRKQTVAGRKGADGAGKFCDDSSSLTLLPGPVPNFSKARTVPGDKFLIRHPAQSR